MSFFFLFQYGISGPYWYAGGATIQIILFAILSIMLKTRAPGAKTFLQVRIYTRHRHDVLVQHFFKTFTLKHLLWFKGQISILYFFSQVIKARFGSRTHIVFCVFAFFTNLIVMMSLTIAGTTVLNSLVKVYLLVLILGSLRAPKLLSTTSKTFLLVW